MTEDWTKRKKHLDNNPQLMPQCDNMRGTRYFNVCSGNEPYSCERMFAQHECPKGLKLNEE